MAQLIDALAKNGYDIVDYETIEGIRDTDGKTPDPYVMYSQTGGQEKLAASKANIIIYGGCRGGGKSHALLLDALNDVCESKFRACILRNERNDLSDLVESSADIYKQFGDYNKSKDDMTWNFLMGGFLKFDYYAGSEIDFDKRFRGKQFAYIGIDEVTHIEYPKFKFLITDNRNAFGLRNRLIGTCNPDPDSWVARFIDWWIGEDGYAIPERDGVVRYCFMDGDDVSTIIWGDTREEVYQQCKGTIDRYWREEYAEYGTPQDLFIKSVTFIIGKLSDNKKLMRSDPTYLANLANQSEEQRARDLDGNWKYKEVGEEMIKLKHMESFFVEPRHDKAEKPYASCDIALEGGDNLVMWKWVGNRTHISDVFVCRLSSNAVVDVVKAKLNEWGVADDCFTYDLNGLGQWFKGHFPHAKPFNNMAGVNAEFKYVYANLKSQAAWMFANEVCEGKISINPDLLDRRFSGHGYESLPLRQILLNERKVIRRDETNTDHGFALPKKATMKKLIGHSPDFVEALFMVKIFDIIEYKRKRVIKGLGFI